MSEFGQHIAVIGCGLWGAAAARHLAEAGHRVTLIGPQEPENKATHGGVFGSHYDEGRITRKLDVDPVWSALASASIDRYRNIENRSGIRFFDELGAVMAGEKGGAFITKAGQIRDSGIASDALEGSLLQQRFPFLSFPANTLAFHEPHRAGTISPRRLVRAQTLLADKAGASVMRAEVRSLRESGAGVEIETQDGTIVADRALVAAGAYSNMVLENQLELTVYARTIALFELEDLEAARLARMPSIVWRTPEGADPYILPPLLYPDGRRYLKLGGDPHDTRLNTPEAISNWFRSTGSDEAADYLQGLLLSLIPDLQFRQRHQATCVTTYTASGYPYVDRVSDRIAVCTGGNGAGAKCSNEVGRLGAEAVLGNCDDRFRARFANSIAA